MTEPISAMPLLPRFTHNLDAARLATAFALLYGAHLASKGAAGFASPRASMSTQEPIVEQPVVGIIMGSQSDWPTLKCAAAALRELGIPFETRIISAHRTPERLFEYAKQARPRGLKVIIAGAGGAAHLPGMAASLTSLPVLGVPVMSKALSGRDSLYSIVQMPAGIPVGTLAIGEPGATNAGLLAAAILALSDPALTKRLEARRARQTAAVALEPVDEKS
jgi:5-(carboxyamino)imidazole ribonucleotide mutase